MAGAVETTNGKAIDGEQENPNPILSLLSKFQHFKFPPWKPDVAPMPEAAIVVAEKPVRTSGGDEENNPAVVKLPNNRSELPSLKLEAENSEPNTNPIILWQVYAIGGFFVLKWLLARWKERSAKKGSSGDEEPSPSDE